MGLFPIERWQISRTVLVLFTFFAAIIIFFCSLCMIRRRGDPARTGFSYLKAALAFFSVFLFLDLYISATVIAYMRISVDKAFHKELGQQRQINILRDILRARSYGISIANFLQDITDVLILLVLLRIGTAITIARTGKPDALGRIVKLVSYAAAAIMGGLVVATFGMQVRVVDVVYRDDVRFGITELDQSRQLRLATLVLFFVLSLGVVARSALVLLQARIEAKAQRHAILIVSCSILWLLHTVYNMAISAAGINHRNPYDNPYPGLYVIITDLFFAIWPQFLVLCITFGIGIKRGQGIWSTEQHWMIHHSHATAWGYGHEQAVEPQPMQQLPPPPPPPQQQQQQQYNQGYFPQQGQQQQQYEGHYPHQVQPQQQDPSSVVSPVLPQQYQQPQYPVYPQPTSTQSPPPHEEAMGFGHQADGIPPQHTSQPYPPKN